MPGGSFFDSPSFGAGIGSAFGPWGTGWTMAPPPQPLVQGALQVLQVLQQSSHLLRLKRARRRSRRLGLQHESQVSQQEVLQHGAGVVQHFGAGAQVVQVLQQSSHLLRLKRARRRSSKLGLQHESQLLHVLQQELAAVAQPLLQPATGAAE